MVDWNNLRAEAAKKSTLAKTMVEYAKTMFDRIEAAGEAIFTDPAAVEENHAIFEEHFGQTLS